MPMTIQMLPYCDFSKLMSPEEQRQEIIRIRKSLAGVRPKTLIVEDDEADAFLAKKALQAHGLESTWVKDSDAAIDALITGDYRIVLLDLDLGTGDSVGDILECCTGTKHCRVIVLTGAFTHDSPPCKDALKAGASAIILKPLTDEHVELIYGTP